MQTSILDQLAAAASSEPSGFELIFRQYGIFIPMALIMWFLILRPQMKQQKEHKAKLGGLKKGDEVLTGGGLLGKILKVDENYAEVEIAPGIKVKALRSTIVDVIPPAGSRPAND